MNAQDAAASANSELDAPELDNVVSTVNSLSQSTLAKNKELATIVSAIGSAA